MVQTEENHCRVDENAADEGDVAQLGTGKFYRSVDVSVSQSLRRYAKERQ